MQQAGSIQQVAVVTGGNRGIGFEIARGCIRAGFRVVLAARDTKRGLLAAQKLECYFVQLDITSPSSIARCAAEIKQRFGHIDALINNASIKTKHNDPTPFIQKARAEITTNFFGTLAVCEAFFPLLSVGSRVVNVASSGGHLMVLPSFVLRCEFAKADTTLTVPQLVQLMAEFLLNIEASRSLAHAPAMDWPHVAKGWPSSAYGMSKLGQVALTKIHAREWAARGISVNCCCPGSVATELNPGGQRTPAQGADTPVWLACQSATAATGQFFVDRTPVPW